MSKLPEGWAEAKIRDTVVDYETVDPRKSPDQSFFYVDIGAIDNSVKKITAPKEFSGREAPSRARRVIRANDVLFSTVRTYLKNVAQVPEHLDGQLTSTGICVLRANEITDPGYLFRWVGSSDFINKISEAQDGTMYPAVRDEDVLSGPIPLPPLPEQRRIVRKLNSFSAQTVNSRTHLTAIQPLIERYKVCVLRMAFNGELTASYRENKAQLPAVDFELSPTQLKKLKLTQHQLPSDRAPYQVPETWRWIALPALGELARGKSKHRPRNDKALFGGPYPFIQTGDVSNSNGRIERYSSTYSEFGLSQSRLWPAGTLCITIAANIAETGILGFDGCFPDSVVGFIADEEKTSASFVEYFIRTVREDLEAFAPGVAQKNINLATLTGIFVPVPPIDEQREIVYQIETAFAKIDRLAAEAENALKLIDRLDERILVNAFAGELVFQDPNDEPAEALLDRIREARAKATKKERHRRTKVNVMKKNPRDLLLADSEEWPENGLPFEEVARRVVLPYDDLRDALFGLLGEVKPKLEQVFDKDESCMHLRRVPQ